MVANTSTGLTAPRGALLARPHISSIHTCSTHTRMTATCRSCSQRSAATVTSYSRSLDSRWSTCTQARSRGFTAMGTCQRARSTTTHITPSCSGKRRGGPETWLKGVLSLVPLPSCAPRRTWVTSSTTTKKMSRPRTTGRMRSLVGMKMTSVRFVAVVLVAWLKRIVALIAAKSIPPRMPTMRRS